MADRTIDIAGLRYRVTGDEQQDNFYPCEGDGLIDWEECAKYIEPWHAESDLVWWNADAREWQPVDPEQAYAEGAVMRTGYIRQERVRELGWRVRRERRRCRGHHISFVDSFQMFLCAKHREEFEAAINYGLLYKSGGMSALEQLVTDYVEVKAEEIIRKRFEGAWS